MKIFIENDSGSCLSLYFNSKSVDLSYSSIVKVGFLDCDDVESLDLSSNKLTSVPEGLPPHLVSLNLSGNLIDYIPENLPDSLEDLNISCNNVRSIPRSVPVGLTTLNIGCNPIGRLKGLEDTNVESLYAFFTDIKSTRNCPIGLKDLDISSTNVSSDAVLLPRTLTEFTAMDCKKMYSMPELNNGLEKINLELTPIRSMLPEQFPDSIRHIICPNREIIDNKEYLPWILWDYDTEEEEWRGN